MEWRALSPAPLFAPLVLALPVTAQPQPVIGPQVRIDVNGGTASAFETTIAAHESNPLEIVAGWNDWRRFPDSFTFNTAFALSLDGGATWDDFLIRPPVAHERMVEGDPMTAADPRTGTLWAGGINWSPKGDSGIYVARKNPGDAFFQPAVMARMHTATDKPLMAAGPRPGMPDTTRLYVAYNEGLIRSDDLGDTWTNPRNLGAGIGHVPRVGPDGVLYIAYWEFDTRLLLKRSTNGGQSFTTHVIAHRMDLWDLQDGTRFPGTFRVPPLVYVDVDRSSGALYAAWFDTTDVVEGQRNVDVYFCRSNDQGETWTTPTIVNGDAATPGDQFFPWIAVDRHGRLHMAYLDTRHTEQFDGVENGMIDAYYAYSVNAGDTWTEHRLTPQSWNSTNDGLSWQFQFIGDYIGLATVGERVYPAYLDTSSGDPDIFTHVIEVPKPGDVNGDGTVDFDDALAVLSAWGPCEDERGCDADLNGDGVIDFGDLLEVLSRWD